MNIEEKDLSLCESLLYISPTLPIIGTFIVKSEILPSLPVLQNIYDTGLLSELLLCDDFIYIKSKTSADLADLKLLTMAEISDYIDSEPTQIYADTDNTNLKIDLLLKVIIAPLLQKDGGDIEQISYKENILSVRFLGKCQNCPYAQRTLKNHVQKNLQRYLPQIREVILT